MGSAAYLEGRPMSAKPIRWMMTGAGKPFVPMEFEIGTLAPDEVLVEIAGCGVCHTDLGYYYDGVRTKHELPLALGHEISGHIVDTGADALWFTDRAVIIPAVIPCGKCDACKRGKATICPNQKMPGNDIQGGFATHIVVPSLGLCVVDEHRLASVGIDLADLSVIADAVTTPYQAVVQAGVTKGRPDRGRHGRRRCRDRCQRRQARGHSRAGHIAHFEFEADVAARSQGGNS
jgi:6-hydroxycyclohex-1-ene-1-carbonyl-CoA dehydrogenase